MGSQHSSPLQAAWLSSLPPPSEARRGKERWTVALFRLCAAVERIKFTDYHPATIITTPNGAIDAPHTTQAEIKRDRRDCQIWVNVVAVIHKTKGWKLERCRCYIVLEWKVIIIFIINDLSCLLINEDFCKSLLCLIFGSKTLKNDRFAEIFDYKLSCNSIFKNKKRTFRSTTTYCSGIAGTHRALHRYAHPEIGFMLILKTSSAGCRQIR